MSATDTKSHEAKLEAENEWLRDRVASLEAELVEVQSRANASVAHWQDRAYWLERWHLDLNRLMRSPGAMQVLAALRLARSAYRLMKRARRRIGL